MAVEKAQNNKLKSTPVPEYTLISHTK